MRYRAVELLLIFTLPCVAACTAGPASRALALATAPLPAVQGVTTSLRVPAICPVYAPGGGEGETIENLFPDLLNAFCAVDSTGGAYGVIDGGASGALLAVVPGSRELGVFFGFKKPPQPGQFVLDGPNATLSAYAAPTNVYAHDCCAEDHPDKQLSPTVVALGSTGALLSLGNFDGAPQQIVVNLDLGEIAPGVRTGWTGRYYVNGAP